MRTPVEGFSKMDKTAKIDWLVDHYASDPAQARALLERYWHPDSALQQKHDEFIENTLTNYYLPFAIAPNFRINDRLLALPMAIEESSVVAAASKAAKFWLDKGGFKAEVLGVAKVGQVHFTYAGEPGDLRRFFERVRTRLEASVEPLTESMRRRGGGLLRLELRDRGTDLDGYYQLHATFDTRDAMGANFINSCLERFAREWEALAEGTDGELLAGTPIKVVMAILSNYVPDCRVRAEVSCPVEDLREGEMDPQAFAEKFVQAVEIARVEPFRAVTHNKGIMNGIDAVVLATGNDFRAIEAGVHAYAARDGRYRSLTEARVENGQFRFGLEVPLALGTVGGLTRLHPLVGLALDLLQRPSAPELMEIVAVAGLAQNFAAVRSLVTTGIQKGHMKMHLLNLLNQLGALPSEKEALIAHFKDHTVSNQAVREALTALRKA